MYQRSLSLRVHSSGTTHYDASAEYGNVPRTIWLLFHVGFLTYCSMYNLDASVDVLEFSRLSE